MRLWSTAVHDFRLTNEDFFALTPSRFLALSNRYIEERQFIDAQAAWTRATIQASNMEAKNRAKIKITDYQMLVEETKKSSKEMSSDEMLNYVKNVMHPAFMEAAEGKK